VQRLWRHCGRTNLPPSKNKKNSKKVLTNSFIHVIIISERNERGKEK
jgi:hypothetical protein